eukprot:Amastigsp_a508862_9.p7 type:complete len:102 gc:universal Amastigsp_a508862_9:1527-1222(-)
MRSRRLRWLRSRAISCSSRTPLEQASGFTRMPSGADSTSPCLQQLCSGCCGQRAAEPRRYSARSPARFSHGWQAPPLRLQSRVLSSLCSAHRCVGTHIRCC